MSQLLKYDQQVTGQSPVLPQIPIRLSEWIFPTLDGPFCKAVAWPSIAFSPPTLCTHTHSLSLQNFSWVVLSLFQNRTYPNPLPISELCLLQCLLARPRDQLHPSYSGQHDRLHCFPASPRPPHTHAVTVSGCFLPLAYFSNPATSLHLYCNVLNTPYL